MIRQARILRLPASGPDDVSALEAAFASGRLDPRAVVAVFGKTEGNGLVNDYTRGLASRALHDCLAAHTSPEQARQVCLVMSGGTEGGLSPHWIVFTVENGDAPERAGALAIGHAHTAALPGHHLGRPEQVEAVAAGVLAAMAQAGLTDPTEVHLVQIKCPLLTSERIAAVHAAGHTVAVADTLKSMNLSRAASALGAAVALGEVEPGAVTAAAIGRDWSLYSARASCSAGVELLGHEIVVLGSAGAGWGGPLRIDHAVMTDPIDIEPVRAALGRLGLSTTGQLNEAQRRQLVALVAKVEASNSGIIRERRHTMLTDSDIAATRHARGFTGGVLAGLLGETELFVSGGAEHQGPDGGGPVALIVGSAAP